MTGNKPRKYYASELADTGDARMEIGMQAIGIVRSSYTERFSTPRQPGLASAEPAIIELNPGHNFEQALQDLDSFSHIWVLYWMHLNSGWNPTVMPPRGPKIRRGLFSTRAPHRPNSIGLSVVRLRNIEGRRLHIEGHDMLDGTPVLDIKPYLTYADSIPEAEDGWAAQVGLAS